MAGRAVLSCVAGVETTLSEPAESLVSAVLSPSGRPLMPSRPRGELVQRVRRVPRSDGATWDRTARERQVETLVENASQGLGVSVVTPSDISRRIASPEARGCRQALARTYR